MDPKKISAWCAAVLAVGAMLAYLGTAIQGRAQDAGSTAGAAAAKVEVDQRIAPMEEQLEILVKQGEVSEARARRSEDKEEFAWCLDREYQDLTKDARDRICNAESEGRWAAWEAEDEQDPD
jgi:hypothetical protein